MQAFSPPFYSRHLVFSKECQHSVLLLVLKDSFSLNYDQKGKNATIFKQKAVNYLSKIDKIRISSYIILWYVIHTGSSVMFWQYLDQRNGLNKYCKSSNVIKLFQLLSLN